MNSGDFRMLFLYEWKSKHNDVAAPRNINATFRNDLVNGHTIRHWYAKSETGDENDKRRTLQTLDCCGQWSFERNSWKNHGNTLWEYAEERGVSPTTISSRQKLIGNV